MTWTPNPDFTFTGEKFRLNGYRTPFVAERLEAGEEGALNGKRLLLGLNNYWTFHYRSNLLSQSKGASDPRLSEPEANPVASNPFGSVGLDYAGPIGDHWGIWTEYYFSANGGNPNVYNIVSNDEYDVKYVFNPGDHIVGMAFTTQSFRSLAGFAPFNSGAKVSLQRSGAGGNGHAPYAHLAMYGLFSDRLLTVLGVSPGDDNLDYQRMVYKGIVALALWAGCNTKPERSTTASQPLSGHSKWTPRAPARSKRWRNCGNKPTTSWLKWNCMKSCST
jgi:hypothetical protein